MPGIQGRASLPEGVPYRFDGRPRTGEMVAAERIADDLLEIFQKLYQAGYPIEKIRLIDDYGGDDAASMRDNNTSCFHFRTISGSQKLSKHSMGLAVDINPLYNPYVKTVGDTVSTEPEEAKVYADRTADFPHKIWEEDLCCRLFADTASNGAADGRRSGTISISKKGFPNRDKVTFRRKGRP